jgi:hypothetical protein
MINRTALLSDLQKLLQRLEADLLERSESAEVPDVEKTLRGEYERAKTAERTAQNYEDWRSDAITQAAAAWVLSCVFVRFLEDNRLIDPPRLSGPTGRSGQQSAVSGQQDLLKADKLNAESSRLQRARDEHELYFREHLKQSDRDFLIAVFDQLATLPGTKDVFGEHNPIRELPNWLSGDAAGELLRFFQKIDANTGELVHDFTDVNWDTRFLGDLYQDLSEAARKKYALLQTPEFVEEFILDHTLNLALDEFGLDAAPVLDKDGKLLTEAGFRMIDPACGSGHFLLGAFPRILDRWQRKEPGTNVRELVQRTLYSIHGVDVNPYAVAIARFRLLLAAMWACNVTRLADAPGFRLNLACGDSLLHAPLKTGQQVFDFDLTNADAECEHAYQAEDLPVLKKMLRGGQYHAVVANPPYITPKDRQLNERYRKRFKSCHMKYSLAVPFLERIFRLAVSGSDRNGGGYTGQITANSFMKREFGKKLIESFFPTVDLTHVLDTAGAYIPGHGTPTVILFGRHRFPVSSTLRTVMGIRGEPTTPDDPARGAVWSAIVAQLDQPGSQSEFVSVGDSERALFHKHPWSIGGGGAAELKEQLEGGTDQRLGALVASIGPGAILGEDEGFGVSRGTNRLRLLPPHRRRPLVEGDHVRDWTLGWDTEILFPYSEAIELCRREDVENWLWPIRTTLENRLDFSKSTYKACGRPFWEFHQIPIERNRTPLGITFAFVATHNHFVLDRGGKIFKQSAPIITLPTSASEDDHYALLGLLNSSTVCFWLKQVSQPKQLTAGDGVRIEAIAKVPHEFMGTQLAKLPLPPDWNASPLRPVIIRLARKIDTLAVRLGLRGTTNAIQDALRTNRSVRAMTNEYKEERGAIRRRMIFLQDELDYAVYVAYGLAKAELLSGEVDNDLYQIESGERPFCIVRQHNQEGFPVPTDVPATWATELQSLWRRRIDAIKNGFELRVIEDPHYKRRWIGRQGKYNHAQNADELKVASMAWLLDRLESYFDFDGRMKEEFRPTAKLDIALVSVAKLADVARQDTEFQHVGELFRDDPAFDVQALVTELVAAECVPLLPVLRYKPSGLIKRGIWERTWDLQRQEDALSDQLSAISDQLKTTSDANTKVRLEAEREKLTADRCSLTASIPVPTKYDSKDFLDSNFWRLRGKLDVPKERWISFPHCEGPDGTPVICWAGYDHLQQARAISAYYVDIQERLGGRDDPRLLPLLACLLELLPWLKQWHNEVDPEFGMAMGDYFEGFVNEEARQLGKTILEIKAWTPPARTGNRGRRRSKT